MDRHDRQDFVFRITFTYRTHLIDKDNVPLWHEESYKHYRHSITLDEVHCVADLGCVCCCWTMWAVQSNTAVCFMLSALGWARLEKIGHITNMVSWHWVPYPCVINLPMSRRESGDTLCSDVKLLLNTLEQEQEQEGSAEKRCEIIPLSSFVRSFKT